MLVYNITLKIDSEIEPEWILWMKQEHIPEVMATDLFTENKFFKLLEQDDSEGPTYVIQYYSTSFENYDRYIQEYAATLRQKAIEKWDNKFIAFRTVMQVVN
jgi:hypothetical protein